jgi:hypothetical protein
MARLGEQLAASGVVSIEKIEQALRAQVVWGGRLGTNLIELGCVELDDLARALGQQHGIPCAQARHFEKADPALQAQLPADIARQFSVVPLVRLSPERIAVVALDPLTPDACLALSSVYGVDPSVGIVMSVAPEMRVLYHLERVYDIPRAARYLRTKKAGKTMEFPAFDNVPLEVDSDTDIAIPITIDQTVHPTGRVELPPELGSAEEIAAMLDNAIDTTLAAPRAHTKDRRHVLKTLADAVEPIGGSDPTVPVSIGPGEIDPPTAGRHDDLNPPTTRRLGRIAIRRVAVPAGGVADERTSEPENLVEATRAIRRCIHRDRVAELVLEAVERFVPHCGAALLLVVRGDVAIGWKHFSRADDGTSEVAVPLDQEGLVPSAIETKRPMRRAALELSALDALLLRAVGQGNEPDSALAVIPITIADQVMCMLAAATTVDADLASLEAIVGAAATAFARLIRDAGR